MAVPSAALAQASDAASDPAAQDDEDKNSEIVVTGVQRREQAVVDVPIAMTSVSGDTIQKAGLTSLTDMSALSPGLVITRSTGFVRPVIRGVGSQVTSLGADANVAVYLDGVYRPNQQSNQFSLADIERVEVLKGPQGTLFGRNATGGAIVITTKRPSLTEASGSLSASYGRFNERELRGYFTAPISSTVGISLSFDSREDDGYARDALLNKAVADHHETLGRVKLLFQPSSDVSVILSAYRLKFDDNTGAVFDILNGNTVNFTAPHYPNPREVAQTFIPSIKVDSWGTDAQVEWNLGGAKFKSITSYADADFYFRGDLDGTVPNTAATTFRTLQRTFTQELSLSSAGPGRFQWSVGGFYYNDKGDQPYLLSTTDVFSLSASIDTQSWAAFGEVEYEPVDGLHLLAGLRYSSETRDFNQLRAGGATNFGKKTWTDVTPRASIRYSVTDRSNIYATYSQGFKSGTFNVTANSRTPVNPEQITAYEVGYKYAGRRTSLGLSAFYYDYKDLQVQALPPGATLTSLLNAGVVHSYGADAEITTSLNDRWDVRAGVAYLHARYASFTNASVFVPLANGHGNSSVAPYNATGKNVEFSPEFTGHVSVTYTAPVGDGEISSTLTASHSGSYFFEPTNRIRSGDQTILNGQITWHPGNNGLELGVWAQNITDQVYPQIVTFSTAGDRVAYARPRTYGVKLGYKF
ncbi:MAG: TonB-dependent receptor [Pseudomonadota bacterium]